MKINKKLLKKENPRLFEELKPYIELPRCHDAVCDSDHNWKYKDENEKRVCKWCKQKQYLRQWGEWY